MALNRNQRRVLDQGLVAFGVGMILTLVVGPTISPIAEVPYLFVAGWGIAGGAGFIYIGLKLSR